MKKTIQPIAVLLFLVICTASVQAATLYWDRNSTVAGASATPNGNWSTTSGQFTTDSTGAGSIISWSTLGSADTAYFAAGSDAVNAYNVTVSGTVSVGGITFGYGGPATIAAGDTPIISLDAATVTILNTVNGTINVELAGIGALDKTGDNTLTLGAAATYSGNTSISAGTVTLSVANAIPSGSGKGNVSITGSLNLSTVGTTVNGLSGAGTVVGASTLTAGANDQSSTFSGNIGSGGVATALTKTGTGTLTLDAANSYTGNTTISQGTLALSGSGAISGSGTISIAGGATFAPNGASIDSGKTLNASGATGTIDGSLTLASGALVTLAFNTNNGATLNVPSGTVTFNDNAFTITVSGGALASPSTHTLISQSGGTVAGSVGGAVIMAGDGITGGGSPFLSISGGALVLSVSAAAGTVHWATGDGVWDTSTANWLGTGTTFTDGDIAQLIDADTTGTPTITLNTLVKPAQFQVNNTATTKFTLTGTGTLAGFSAGSTMTKDGTGTLTIGVVSTIPAGVTLNAGQINVDSTTALGAGTSPFTIAGGALGNSSGGAITLANNNVQNWNGDFSFEGTSDLNLGTGAATMSASRTVTVNANNLTVGGVISGSGFALTKDGSGTLTLGGANTYSGDTRIVAGSLVLGNSSGLASSALDMNTADSGTLVFASGLGTASFANLKGDRAISLQDESSGAVDLTVGGDGAAQTFNGSISGSGSLTKTGAGALSVGNAGQTWTHTGGTTVNSGSILRLANSLDISSAPLTVNGVLQSEGRTITINGLSGSGTLTSSANFDNADWIVGNGNASSTFSGQIIKSPIKNNSLKKVGTGTLTIVQASAGIGTVNGVRIEAGRIVAKNTGSLGSFRCTVGGQGTAAALEMNSVANVTWDTQMSLILSNSATLVSSGGFTIRYSKSNFPEIDQASGSAVTIAPATSTDTLQFGAAVQGGSATSLITLNGTGTNQLESGSSSGYAGNWAIANGTLKIENANSLGSSTGTRALTMSGGVFEPRVSAGATYNVDVTVSGNASIVPNRITVGAGVTQTLGTLSIGANTLTVVPGDQTTSGTAGLTFGATTLTGAATFTVNNSGSANALLTLGAVGETGSQSLTKNGAGQLNLNSVNTYSGTTTVSAGTLLVNSPGSTAAGSAVTVGSGATIGGTGTILGTLNIQAGGTLSPGASIGTLTNAVAPTLSSTSTNLMEINRTNSPNADQLSILAGGGALAFNGTLTVVNTGPDLVAGDTFDLFDDPDGFSGSFSVTNLPSLNGGLFWNTSQLAVNGTISVGGSCIPATVDAGSDQTVCASSPNVTLAGSFGGATNATWSGGAGVFTPNNTTTNATYAPTAGEITAGTVTLTLTTDIGGTCGVTNDSMTITINPAATVNAGPDQTVSAGSPTVTLAGTFGGAATNATWSGGAGIFTPNNTTTNATYTPTAGEISAGTVTLTLTSDDPAGPCGAVNDSMTITILNPVTITSIGGTSISYTGGTGAQFVLLNSTNVTAPLSGWSREATNTVTPGAFTIPAVGTSGDTLFYNIKSE